MTILTETAGKPPKQRKSRLSSAYEIEAVTKALQVLEALEGIGFEPVPINTIVGRTGLAKDFVFRALKTLEMRGYAVKAPGGKWTVGTRVLRFSGRYGDMALSALAKGDM